MFTQSIAHRVIFIPALLVFFGTTAFCADSPFAKFKRILDLSEAKREAAVQNLNISSEKHRTIISAKIK